MWNEARLALAAFRLYRDPTRLDEVLDAGVRLARANDADRVATELCERSPAFAEAFRERHIIRYDLADLARHPAGSLGRAVYDHCAKWSIDPASFPARPLGSSGDYLVAHVENTHDVWHPVCGFESDAIGELGLQAFYLAQFPNMLALLLLAVANVHVLRVMPSAYPRLMDEVTRGWLLGKRARSLLGVRWDEQWSRPLRDLQRELGIDPSSVARILAEGAPEPERLAWLSEAAS